LTLTLGQGASIAGVNTLHATSSYVLTQLHEQIVAYCQSSTVPGYVAGVYHDGQQSVVAHGLANVVTGAPMRDDTGFLFGSVTKVLTTRLVLQQVERGAVDLDEHVITYLPGVQAHDARRGRKDSRPQSRVTYERHRR
jgi:CubicO group peptidase (beta-lactamase class C family)